MKETKAQKQARIVENVLDQCYEGQITVGCNQGRKALADLLKLNGVTESQLDDYDLTPRNITIRVEANCQMPDDVEVVSATFVDANGNSYTTEDINDYYEY